MVKMTKAQKIEVHKKLREFGESHKQIESNIDNINTKVNIFKQITKMLREDREKHKELISVFFQCK